MKPQQARELLKSLKDRGWVEHENVLYRPAMASKLKIEPAKKKTSRTKGKRTGSTDDTRNIKNKEEKQDAFIRLINLQLKLVVWPEFYFTTDRQWRFDYCIPEHNLYIEVEGGIWSGGRHTRGKGFLGDMEKYNCAASKGWRMIRVTPTQLITEQTIELIKTTLFLT